MNNMQCQIQDHNGQKFFAVCMDKQCKSKQRLCCLTCLIQLHNTHQHKTVDIDKMNEFLQKENKNEVPNKQSFAFGQKQIIQGLENLSSLIDSLQKIIKEKIEKAKQQSLQNELKKTSNSQQGIQYWNQLLEDILQYVEVDNGQIKSITSKEGELNETEKGQIKIIKQSEQSLQNIISQFTQPQMNNEIPKQIQIDNQIQIKLEKPQQMKIGKLYFDEKRKHKDIVIIDQSTIRNINSYGDAMAFANEGFDPKNQSYAFAFNIQKCGYLLIGVGNEEGRIAPSYLFGNRDLGHGLYMLSNMGGTYHHTDESFNWKERGMSFETGDKIQIKYYHVTKVLEFRRSSDQKTLATMPITDMTKKLYPCAMLLQGEQVQLTTY